MHPMSAAFHPLLLPVGVLRPYGDRLLRAPPPSPDRRRPGLRCSIGGSPATGLALVG